jgi:hypothetical protein
MLEFKLYYSPNKKDAKNTRLHVGDNLLPCLYRNTNALAFIPNVLQILMDSTKYSPETVVFGDSNSLNFYRRNWNVCISPELELQKTWEFGGMKIEFQSAITNPLSHYTLEQYHDFCKELERNCLSNADKTMVLYQGSEFIYTGKWGIDVLDDGLGTANSLLFTYCG